MQIFEIARAYPCSRPRGKASKSEELGVLDLIADLVELRNKLHSRANEGVVVQRVKEHPRVQFHPHLRTLDEFLQWRYPAGASEPGPTMKPKYFPWLSIFICTHVGTSSRIRLRIPVWLVMRHRGMKTVLSMLNSGQDISAYSLDSMLIVSNDPPQLLVTTAVSSAKALSISWSLQSTLCNRKSSTSAHMAHNKADRRHPSRTPLRTSDHRICIACELLRYPRLLQNVPDEGVVHGRESSPKVEQHNASCFRLK